MKSYCIRVGPKSKGWSPYKRRPCEDTGTHRHRAECHVKTEVEIGGIQLHAKERQGLLATTRNQERGVEWILLQSLQKEPALLTP